MNSQAEEFRGVGWNWAAPGKRERREGERSGVEKVEPPGRQIKFSLRGGSLGPIVAFYMQSKAKLWRAETPTVASPLCYLLTGSIIVQPAAVSADSFYLNVFSPRLPPPPLTRKFLCLTIRRTFPSPGILVIVTKLGDFRGKERWFFFFFFFSFHRRALLVIYFHPAG